MSSFVQPNQKGAKGDTGSQGIPGITKHIEISQGTTNASGLYTFTYAVPFVTNLPHVSAEMIPSPDTEAQLRITACSLTSITVQAFRRTGLTVLGLTLLSLATVNINGQAVSIMAMER